MPIFIRCPGHLWVDCKFGQFGDPGDLTEDEWSEGWIPAGERHAVRRSRKPAALAAGGEGMRDGETVLLHMVPYDPTTPHGQAPRPDPARQPEVITPSAPPDRGTDDSRGRGC